MRKYSNLLCMTLVFFCAAAVFIPAHAITVINGLSCHSITPISAVLTWNEVGSAADYAVFVRSGENPETQMNSTKSPSLLIDNLLPSREYSFRVEAYDKADNLLAQSGYYAFTTAPDRITQLVYRQEGYDAVLSWNEVDAADYYEIYIQTQPEDEYKPFARALTVNEHFFSTSNLPEKFNFIVRGYREHTAGYFSRAIAVTAPVMIAAPARLMLQRIDDTHVKLLWDAVDGAKDYCIYIFSVRAEEWIMFATTDATSYVLIKSPGDYDDVDLCVTARNADRGESKMSERITLNRED